MRHIHRKFYVLGMVIVILLVPVSGCQDGDLSPSMTGTPASPQAGISPDTESAPGSPAALNETGSPQATARPGVAAETSEIQETDWREVPILPEVNQHVFEIYQDGQAQGRDPHNFSVIGDCQAIPFVFMGPFARREQVPDSVESYLWAAIDQFADSFSRSGMAVRGGFTAASILNPLQADPHFCISGETPLTCEYRLHNPAYVFITLETWLDPATIDRYELYLRQILNYVIGKGSIPILLTKADASEVGNGVHVINPAIVRVARDYDVPVINFWRAAQVLDNHGIDPEREGFHLSQEGYNLKNILALRTLHLLWSAVEPRDIAAGTPENPGAPTALPTQQAAPTSPVAVQITMPDCAGGCIFFGTVVSRDGVVTAHGVFAYNYETRELTQVLGEGFDLQDVSQDGRRLLVNESNFLYEINLGEASSSLISDTFLPFGHQGAYWDAADSQVIYLDQDRPIQTETGAAIDLFPSTRQGEVYFESGSCTSKANCQPGGVYRLDPDQTLTRLDSYSRLVFSPDGRLAAFLNPAAATQDNYYHIGYLLLEDIEQGISSRRVFYFPEERGFMIYPDVREYAFSPRSNWLFILYDVYSAYFEKSLRLQTYLLDIRSGILYDFGKVSGASGSLSPRLVWAPEGDKVLIFLTDLTAENQYSMSIYQTNVETGERLILYDQGIITSGDYFYITHLYWR